MALSAILIQDEKLGRRREARWRVRLGVRRLNGIDDGQLLDVIDLSNNGFLLETSEPLKTGSCLVVEIPGGITKICKMVWASGKLHGATFADPLTDYELEELISSASRAWPIASGVPRGAPVDPVESAFASDGQYLSDEDEKLPLSMRLGIIVGLSIVSWVLIGTGAWLALG